MLFIYLEIVRGVTVRGLEYFNIQEFVYIWIVDFRSGRTLSCGHGLSLLVATLLRGLQLAAIPAGVAALHSNQLISLYKESYLLHFLNTSEYALSIKRNILMDKRF